MNDERECEYCHVNLPQRPRRGGQRKRFCSNRCRLAAHSERHKQKMEWLTEHVSYEGEECLIWPFGKTTYGYAGPILQDSRYEAACRVMCKLAHGPAPTPKHETAHSCGKGTEGCINPKHLRWATSLENRADRELHRALRLQNSEEKERDTEDKDFAEDVLKGAHAIALFLYGTADRRREVYGMSAADRKRFGLFHIGRTIHGRKSRIKEGWAEMEAAGK